MAFKVSNKLGRKRKETKEYSIKNMLPKKYRHYKRRIVGDKLYLTEK